MIERFLAAPNEPDQPDPNLDPVRPIQEEAWVQIEFIKYTIGLIENLNRFWGQLDPFEPKNWAQNLVEP